MGGLSPAEALEYVRALTGVCLSASTARGGAVVRFGGRDHAPPTANVAFEAMALHAHPQARARARETDPADGHFSDPRDNRIQFDGYGRLGREGSAVRHGVGSRATPVSAGPRYTPLAEVVTEALRAAIFEGQIAPGSPIRQEAVARELGYEPDPGA